MSIWLKIMQSTVCISTAYRLSSIPPIPRRRRTRTQREFTGNLADRAERLTGGDLLVDRDGDVVAKAHSDRKARHFSFSTSSHPTKGRSIDVLVTASTRVMLDAPLGW